MNKHTTFDSVKLGLVAAFMGTMVILAVSVLPGEHKTRNIPQPVIAAPNASGASFVEDAVRP